ncbi:MAG: DUF4386 family protein [Dehalococcoidia bacterium]
MGEEKRVFQIGGISGLLAGVLFLLIVPIFVLLLPSNLGDTPDSFLGTVFPQNQGVFTLMGILALVSSLLSVALFLALHRSLKGSSPTYALGALLFYFLYVGLFIFSPGELVAQLFVTPPLADLYGAAGTEAARAGVVQMFQVLDLIGDQMFFANSLFVFLSAAILGVLVWKHQAYGRIYAGITLLAALVIILTLPFLVGSPGMRVPYVPAILWLVFGWRVYRLSRGIE